MLGEILIVEDNKHYGDTLVETLSKMGYSTFLAEGVQEALQVLEGRGHRIGAAIVDVHLSGDEDMDWSGLALARDIGARNIPVIVLSAYDEPDDKARAFGVGPGVPPPVAFLSKNVESKELKRNLREVLKIVEQERKSVIEKRPFGEMKLVTFIAMGLLAVMLWADVGSENGPLIGIVFGVIVIIVFGMFFFRRGRDN